MGIDAHMKRAVFLDRDGVLNRAIVRDGKPYPPPNVSELEILPGVEEALAALRKAGFLLIVVTNQPDVARGTTTREESRRSTPRSARCCRSTNSRPATTTPKRAANAASRGPVRCWRRPRFTTLISVRSYMVGDRWRDAEAGQRAGCKTIFIDYRLSGKATRARRLSCRRLCRSSRNHFEVKLLMKTVKELKVKMFADGADKASMLEMNANPLIQGLTTNPTLMKKAGITDYRSFCKDILTHIKDQADFVRGVLRRIR